MSRSKRKTKIFGITTAASEKEDKKKFHKIHRSLERETLNKIQKEKVDADEVMFYNEEESMSVWSMDKDGRSYWIDADDEDMRK